MSTKIFEMKIVTILGARPQFIKAGSVSREILKRRESGVDIEEVIVHTGQHYDANMSDIFFDELKIPKPDYFLGIGGKSHGAMTGQMIEKIEALLLDEKPDYVLVYGDTNSTLAGALAAAKLHIKIAHVEAGLRSFNMNMPEEVNRILTDRISAKLFCPTQAAVNNLEKEGIRNWVTNAEMIISGDVMQDGALFFSELAQKPGFMETGEDYVLCTIHRAENTDHPERMESIVSALNQIGKNQKLLLPLHPRTKKILTQSNLNTDNMEIVDPVGYLQMIWLIKNCQMIITDSGGLQKEAFFFGKSCITLRDETEWLELVNNGFNVLAGADSSKIIDTFKNQDFNTDFDIDLYGKGKASSRIISSLLN